MHAKGQITINHRQMAWLTSALLTGGSLFTMQYDLARMAREAAWTSFLLPLAYALIVVSFFRYLAKKFPKQNIFDIAQRTLGRKIGFAVNVILLIYIWLTLLRNVELIVKFVRTVLLSQTPETMIVLLFMTVLWYFGATSIEVVARVNDIYHPIFLFIAVLLPLFLSNEIELYHLQPLLIRPFSDMLNANLIALGWFGDIFILGAFLHTVASSKQISGSLRHGVILAVAVHLLFTVLDILVFGDTVTGNLSYPNYSLVQQIHVTDFLDRVDIFLLGIWFPSMVCGVGLIYTAILIGFASLLRTNRYTMINKPLGLLAAVSAPLAFPDAPLLFSFANYGTIGFVCIVQPVLMLILLMAARRHKGTADDSAPRHEGADATTNPRSAALQKLSRRLSFTGWRWVTNAAVAGCFIAVIVPSLFARHYVVVGTGGAIVFGLLMLIALFTSYLEIVAAQAAQRNATGNGASPAPNPSQSGPNPAPQPG